MPGLPPLQTISTGCVVAIVGFFSSFPILLTGVKAMGASPDQAANALMWAAIAMGMTAIVLALATRQPISVAWSTPGAALLAVTPALPGGFSEAIWGFVVAGLLTVFAGLWRPLRDLAARIPNALALAMLAGVLVPICVVPFQALGAAPWVAIPIVLTWFVTGLFNRLFAAPAAVLAASAVLITQGDWSMAAGALAPGLEAITPIWPTVTLAAALNVGLPLFVVTMATQNIPGIAVLRANGYAPPAGRVLGTVGFASAITAPFGSPATCIAAITAAMCAGEDSHPDPARRYWSAVVAGVIYCLFGLGAGLVVLAAAAAPALTLGTLAGVALLPVLTNSAQAALADAETREAAAITFLVTISGLSVVGITAPVWGLVLGGLAHLAKSRLGTSR